MLIMDRAGNFDIVLLINDSSIIQARVKVFSYELSQ